MKSYRQSRTAEREYIFSREEPPDQSQLCVHVHSSNTKWTQSMSVRTIIKEEAIHVRGSEVHRGSWKRRGRGRKDVNTVLIYDILEKKKVKEKNVLATGTPSRISKPEPVISREK